MECGGCIAMLGIFLCAGGGSSSRGTEEMEPVTLLQVQLRGVLQDRVMYALLARQYGVSSGNPSASP